MNFYILCLVGLAMAEIDSLSTALADILVAKNLTIFKAYLDKYPFFESQLATGNVTSEYCITSDPPAEL